MPPSGAQNCHARGLLRRNASDRASALLSVASVVPVAAVVLVGSEPLASGTAPLMSLGVPPPPQAASNRLAAISLSTKPFRLMVDLIVPPSALLGSSYRMDISAVSRHHGKRSTGGSLTAIGAPPRYEGSWFATAA